MKISKKQLEEALAIVKPGLADRELVAQSTSFAFIKGWVVTYNNEISIRHPVEGLDIVGAVRAEELYQLLGKVKAEEIEVTVNDTEILLKAGRAKAGFTLQTEIKLPLNEEVSEVGKWKELGEDFISALKFCIPVCPKDYSRPLLMCINVTKDGIVESSDSYCVARYTLEKEMPVNTFLLPAANAAEVVKLPVTHIAEGNGWIHFKTEEGTVISCRILEDSYPATAHLLKVDGKQIVFPEEIRESLDRATIFSKKDRVTEEMLRITMNDNLCKIESESENAWFEEELETTYNDESIDFAITPYLLRRIVGETLSCTMTTSKLKFEGENWVYVTALRNK